MAVVTWGDVITQLSNTITSFASANCDNVGKTGSAPAGWDNVASNARLVYDRWGVVDRITHETVHGHNIDIDNSIKVYTENVTMGVVGGQIYTNSEGISGYPSGLNSSVSTTTIASEFKTYITRYVPDAKANLTQTRLSAVILQTLMFVANKFISYTAASQKFYYKSDSFTGGAYVGTSVNFFDSTDFNNDSTTLTRIGDAIKNISNIITVVMLRAATSAISSTSSSSSSSSTSSSCSSSSCSSSSSSSCSSNSCCSSSCSCWFIAFYDIGVM